MKLSAKITTVTFLAAMALGAAALTGGCTVTSTSGTDTDGGPSSSSGGSSGGSSSGTPSDTDSGTDSGAATCDGNDKQTFKFPDECQSCLEAKCCDKLKSCFGQDPAADGGADVDCNVYAKCVSDCNADPGADATCYEACDAATNQSIITAYEILSDQCAAQNCGTECGGN